MSSFAGDLTVTVASTGRETVLVAAGEADVFTRSRLAEPIVQALSAGSETITVDVSGLTFIDVTGMEILIDLTNMAEEAGSQLIVRAPSQQFTRAARLVDPAGVLQVER